MPNPYEYDPSLDEDIFKTEASEAPTTHKHTVDGSVCPSCGVIHDEPPSDVDPRIIDNILSLVDHMPEELARNLLNMNQKARTPEYAKMLMSFVRYSSNLDNANMEGPLLRAIVEVLDKQTNGQITARWRVYEIERRLITSHMSRKAADKALGMAQEEGSNAKIISLLRLMRQFMIDRINFLTPVYIEECEKSGIECHHSIIETGEYVDIGETSRIIMLDDMMGELDE